MSKLVDLILSGTPVSEAVVQEKADLHQKCIALFEKLISKTFLDGMLTFETELDSDGETDYCIGSILPKDISKFKPLGDRAMNNLFMSLYFYLEKGLKAEKLDDNVDWELDEVADNYKLKFIVRIDRT